MHDTLKFLYDVGFTPLNIVLVVAVVTLWRVGIAKDKKQSEDRDAWHRETREQIGKLEAHTKACDEDRAKLKGQIEILSRACPKADCPKRIV